MPAAVQPTDLITKDNIFSGMPFVSFAPKLSTGGYDPYIPFGVVDSAELQRTVDPLEVGTQQYGTRRIVVELVQNLEQRLQVQVVNFAATVFRYFIGSKIATAITANPAQAVTNDEVTMPSTDFTNTFFNFDNKDLAEPLTGVTPDEVVLEFVGVGDGSLGPIQGDFALAYAIKLITDVTLYQETSAAGVAVDRTADLVAGSGPISGEIGIIVAAGATSGEIKYFAGEAPPAGTTIEVTYQPTFAIGDFAINTDYTMDPKGGRARMLLATQLRSNQPVTFGYTYNRKSHVQINPGTQTSFNGKLLVEHLTNQYGINFAWPIPDVTLQLTSDPFAWVGDNAAMASMLFTLNAAPGVVNPYGTIDHYSQPQANL